MGTQNAGTTCMHAYVACEIAIAYLSKLFASRKVYKLPQHASNGNDRIFLLNVDFETRIFCISRFYATIINIA